MYHIENFAILSAGNSYSLCKKIFKILLKGIPRMPEKMKLLIKRNPFVRGMVRIVDMGCVMDRNFIGSEFKVSEWDKISMDWINVGKDISNSIENYRNQHAHASTE